MSSIIPFFILLLATFAYSVPIGNYQFTTSQPFVNQGVPVNIRLTSNNQTTNVSIVYPDQSSEGSNSNEVTTWAVTRSPRAFGNTTDSSEVEDLSEGNYEESSVPTSTQPNHKRAFEQPASSSESESSEKRSYEQSSFPTSTQITQKRAFEQPASSSESESSEKRSYDQSSFPPPIQTNQKRAFEEPALSSESESNEKRSSQESSFPSTDNTNEYRTLKRTPQGTIINKKPRSFVDSDSYSTPFTSTVPFTTSTGINGKRAVENFLYTTLESSTEFNQRAIRPDTSAEVESSTFYPQNQMELTTAEPTSSVQAFGQYTGLLDTLQSSTSNYETTQPTFQASGLTKTVSIIPGKITETKIFGNSPNQYSQPIKQQLSQVQNQ